MAHGRLDTWFDSLVRCPVVEKMQICNHTMLCQDVHAMSGIDGVLEKGICLTLWIDWVCAVDSTDAGYYFMYSV